MKCLEDLHSKTSGPAILFRSHAESHDCVFSSPHYQHLQAHLRSRASGLLLCRVNARRRDDPDPIDSILPEYCCKFDVIHRLYFKFCPRLQLLRKKERQRIISPSRKTLPLHEKGGSVHKHKAPDHVYPESKECRRQNIVHFDR